MAGELREVSADVHKLAYQLHPAKLDQLGLVTTARSWCRDLSQQSGLTIDFSAEHVPPDLSPDVSLCSGTESFRNRCATSSATVIPPSPASRSWGAAMICG